METIKEVLLNINEFLLALKINAMYVLLWVAAGYIQKVYLKDVIQLGALKLNEVWKTLILGSLFSLVYALLLRDYGVKNTWIEFTASYIFATSMYELFLKDLVNLILTKAKGLFTKKLED